MGTNPDTLPLNYRDALATADGILNDLASARPLEGPAATLAAFVFADGISGNVGACISCGEPIVDTLRSGPDGTTCLHCLAQDDPRGLFITHGTDHFNAWAGIAEVDA